MLIYRQPLFEMRILVLMVHSYFLLCSCSYWLLYFVLAFQHGLCYLDETFVNITVRDDNYSSGQKEWTKEKPALLNTMKALQDRFPQFWANFKKAALLPHYNLRYLQLLFSSLLFRRYFSLRLLWRLLATNRLIVRVGRLFPHRMVLRIRKLLRA